MSRISGESSGVFVIGVTPFMEDGALDEASLDRVVDFYFEKGSDGLTILGMMGEAHKLTQEEALRVARRTLQRSAGKPVVVGASAPGLAQIVELGKAAMDLGAAGIMVAPPHTLKTNEQIAAYYAEVAQALGNDVPLVLQDFPLSTGVNISIATLQKIIADNPSIVMLKHEDWPGLAKISALRDGEQKGDRRLSILCGNGGLFLPQELARGADGAMTGFAYPEMMVEVVQHAKAGDLDRAEDIFDAYLPLVRYEQQPGIGLGMRKHILTKRGAIASATQRRPGAALAAAAVAEVEHMISRLERRIGELA